MLANDTEFFEAQEAEFNRVMVSNDVDQIAQCIAEDWVLVTPEVGLVIREAMLGAIGQGRLSRTACQ